MTEVELQLFGRLADFYNSEYVRKNQPWVLETPFGIWVQREMLKHGVML